MFDLTRDEIDELLRQQLVGRIGCHAGGETYVVPVIYAYDGEAVHVASVEGRKVEMMRRNPDVCFEVDTYGPDGWKSVIVHGEYEELDEANVATALGLLRERVGQNGGRRRRPQAGGRAAVWFRINVREATGRATRP